MWVFAAGGHNRSSRSSHVYFDDCYLPPEQAKHFNLLIQRSGGKKSYVVSRRWGADFEAGEDFPSREFRAKHHALDYIRREVAGTISNVTLPYFHVVTDNAPSR